MNDYELTVHDMGIYVILVYREKLAIAVAVVAQLSLGHIICQWTERFGKKMRMKMHNKHPH